MTMSHETPMDSGHIDWQQYRFNIIEGDDLFWMNTDNTFENKPWRKISDTEAFDIRERKVWTIESDRMVYQKEQ